MEIKKILRTVPRIAKKAAPLVLAVNLWSCGEEDHSSTEITYPPNFGGAGGTINIGGSGGTDSYNCTRNNPGKTFIHGEKKHYIVGGNTSTCEEIHNLIFDPENGVGFWDEDLQQRYADQPGCNNVFVWSYDTNCETKKGICCCTTTVADIVTIYPDTYVKIPRWIGCNTNWDKFLEGLITHGQGHIDSCWEIGNQYLSDIAELEYRKCDTTCDIVRELTKNALRNKVNSLFADTKTEWEIRKETYDNETNHGATQGAVLNCE